MTELATQELARARAARIRAGIGAYLATLADVAAAYRQRDWQALGYADWQAYVDGEYSEHKLRLSPEHRQKAVAELRLAGMSQRAIGSALGISKDTVARELAGVADETPDEIQGADGKSYAATRPSQPNREPAEEPSPGSAASPLGSVDASEAPTVAAVGAGETAAGNDTWPADGAGDPHPPAPALAAPVEGADAAGVTPAPWSDEENDLLKRLRDGETVVVSMRTHTNLISWADTAGLYERIDRRTPWGNPFELPVDGDRDAVIAAYEHHYLPHKPSLLSKLESLRGKALGCWCAPEACHGDVLKARAER